MNNEFSLFKNLCVLEKIVEQFPDKNGELNEIKALQARLSTRLYRIAVIGEFKRGKSSLINSILGINVLPTNILPTTAVINRIHYSDKKFVSINYHDGKKEEKTFDDLINYGTKRSSDINLINSISEIEIGYPAIFLQNNISIIDTPGLNDDENMTAKTLGVLGDIDSAVMVIHAEYQMSAFEKEVVVKLASQKNINHIVFVVTFIDRFINVEEQELAIDMVRQRIQNDVLNLFVNKHQGNDELLKKGYKIFSSPQIFGVSAKLAMEGFISGNNDILNKSRFPEFKRELLTLLTANQSTDMFLSVKDKVNDIYKKLPSWYSDYEKELDNELIKEMDKNNNIVDFMENAKRQVSLILEKMSQSLANNGLSEQDGYKSSTLTIALKKVFIGELSKIRFGTFSNDSIRDAIKMGFELAQKQAQNMFMCLEKLVFEEMTSVEEYTVALNCKLPKDVLLDLGSEKFMNFNKQFPIFRFQDRSLLNYKKLTEVEIIPIIENTIESELNKYGKCINQLITSWRAKIFNYINHQIEACRAYISTERIEHLNFEKENLKNKAAVNNDELRNIISSLNNH